MALADKNFGGHPHARFSEKGESHASACQPWLWMTRALFRSHSLVIGHQLLTLADEGPRPVESIFYEERGVI